MGAMKTVLGIAVACALGVLAGGYAMGVQAEKRLAGVSKERDALQVQVRRLHKQVEDLYRVAQRDEQVAQSLTAQLEQRRAASVAETPAVEPGTATEAKPTRDSAPARPSRSGAPGFAGVPGALEAGAFRGAPRLSPEERAERRTEYSQRMRERVQSVIDDEIQRATDPAAQQRLLALREQADAMVESLRRVQETKEDEAARAEALEQFQAARAAMVSMVREQQDYMLRQVAAQNGIADPQRQQAFVESVLQLQQSPFFQAPTFMEDPEGSGDLR